MVATAGSHHCEGAWMFEPSGCWHWVGISAGWVLVWGRLRLLCCGIWLGPCPAHAPDFSLTVALLHLPRPPAVVRHSALCALEGESISAVSTRRHAAVGCWHCII